jgi:integrase
MRAAQIRARQELPRQPQAAQWSQVLAAVNAEASLPLAVAIIISWVTAARCGCVLQLHRSDVTLHEDRSLSVRFRKGKGARIRGPYTVHTAPLPERLHARVTTWLNQRHNTLFPMIKGEAIKNCLRKVDKKLEQRSLRRGALQTLSTLPAATDALLMEFSGHTQVRTLRRYLNWGAAAVHLRDQMRGAAVAIFGRLPTIETA